MSIVTTIVDALRRIGTASEKSAIQRQDEYVGDRTVIDRRSNVLRSELGQTSVLAATVPSDEETVSPLSAEDLVPLLANADRVHAFLAAFATPDASDLFLDRLDDVFAQ